MNLYTYKPDSIIVTNEFWTGGLDDYFNKCFIYKKITPFLLHLDDKCAQIVDECNSANIDQPKELEKLKNILSKTHNSLFEFIDENGVRGFIDIMNCGIKKFDYKTDIDIYVKKQKIVGDHNLSTEKDMFIYLFSINAYGDFFKYHKGRGIMFNYINDIISTVRTKGIKGVKNYKVTNTTIRDAEQFPI